MDNKINNIGQNLTANIALAINEWLEYADGFSLNLITKHFNINPMTADKYDYGCYMDAILYWCNDSLSNSVELLNFINNEYK